jgi:uncharacterized iron-regulated membrane protein
LSAPATRPLLDRLKPWAGFYLGGGAWFTHQQLNANTNYTDCSASGPVLAILTGLLCIAIAAAGALVSWRARRRDRVEGAADQSVRGFLGEVSAMAAGVFALAILFGMLAGLTVPECWR